MQPLISVIIPVYNAEKYLNRSINSVLMQTYPNIEIVLVDDGSTDLSGRICDEYSMHNKNIKVIHQENKGVCGARNTGIDNSKGEFVCFLDSDDFLLEDALQFLYDKISSGDFDISVCKQQKVRNEKEIKFCQSDSEDLFWYGQDALINSIEDHSGMYSACAKLFRKGIIENIRFDEGRSVHEDSFFLFKCAFNNPSMILSQRDVLIVYLTENSASRGAFSNKYFDILYFADKKKELLEKYHPELKDKITNLIIKANMAMLRKLSSQGSFKYFRAEKKCIHTICKNKTEFKPAIAEDEKWFWIIIHKGYFLYKSLYLCKNKIKRILSK